MASDNGQIRQFDTGATRDTGVNKLDPFGFVSPLALHRFSEYMHKHRLQSDGSLRDSDNWKKGMPPMEYVRSLLRHVFDFWLVMSGLQPRFDPKVTDPEEIACAVLFNVQGFLHEVLQKKPLDAYQGEVNSEWKRTLAKIGTPMPGSAADGLIAIDGDLDREVDEAFERLTNMGHPDVVVGTLTNGEDWKQERAWK